MSRRGGGRIAPVNAQRPAVPPVARLAACGRGGRGRLRRRRHCAHAAENQALAPLQPERELVGVDHARVDDAGGQQRGLVRTELRGGLAKVRPRRRLRAVDAVAPLDHVEVDLEDARLAQRRLEPPRDEQLAQLAQRVLRRRQVEVLRQLLRDRAAAAEERALLEVPLERLADLLDVDPLVLPEAGVLRDEHGPLECRRDPAVAHPPLLAARRLALGARLGGPQLDEGGRRRVRGAQAGDVRQRGVHVAEVTEGRDERAEKELAERSHARHCTSRTVP